MKKEIINKRICKTHFVNSRNENEERGENPLLSRNCDGNESQLDHCAEALWYGKVGK